MISASTPFFAAASRPCSSSSGLRTSIISTFRFIPGAAASITFQLASAAGLSGLVSVPMRVMPGASALSNSRRFAPSSATELDSPVTCSIGSAIAAATTGMPLSVSRAASVAGVPRVRNTSTFRRASSAASAGKRSARPSAERYRTM